MIGNDDLLIPPIDKLDRSCDDWFVRYRDSGNRDVHLLGLKKNKGVASIRAVATRLKLGPSGF